MHKTLTSNYIAAPYAGQTVRKTCDSYRHLFSSQSQCQWDVCMQHRTWSLGDDCMAAIRPTARHVHPNTTCHRLAACQEGYRARVVAVTSGPTWRTEHLAGIDPANEREEIHGLIIRVRACWYNVWRCSWWQLACIQLKITCHGQRQSRDRLRTQALHAWW